MNPIPVPDHINPAPPKPRIDDPTYQHKLEHDVSKVGRIVAELAAIARFVPNPYLRAGLSFLAALEKDPDTGKVGPGKTTLQNLAPSPIGFADAELYGIRRNWWLPNGTTGYLPEIVIEKLPGGVEQARLDRFLNARTTALRLNEAQKVVEGLNARELNDILQDNTLTTLKVAAIRAGGGIGGQELKDAARAEQLLRELPVRPARLVPVVIENADGTFSPLLIDPNNALAMANAEKAEGIRKELIHERADP